MNCQYSDASFKSLLVEYTEQTSGIKLLDYDFTKILFILIYKYVTRTYYDLSEFPIFASSLSLKYIEKLEKYSTAVKKNKFFLEKLY